MRGAQHQKAAVDIVDLTAGYERGKPVFQDFTVAFPERAVTVVRGKNGSGKTTLVELCSGYLRPWRGVVRVAGHGADSDAARALRRVCRTEPALYPNMTARDHLVFAARCRGVDAEPTIERAAAYGLGEWLGAEAKTLSTGNRRKLWVVMCTLGGFEAVILDEPFNGLDTEGRERLAAEMRAWADADAAVVVIAHAMPDDVSVDHAVDLADPDPATQQEA